MKYQEVLERLQKGEEIHWYSWEGTRYSLNYKIVSSATIDKLKKNGLITILRSKDAPLTGKIVINR